MTTANNTARPAPTSSPTGIDTSVLAPHPDLKKLEAALGKAGARCRELQDAALALDDPVSDGERLLELASEAVPAARDYAVALVAWSHLVLTEASKARPPARVAVKHANLRATHPLATPTERAEARTEAVEQAAMLDAATTLERRVRNRLLNTFPSWSGQGRAAPRQMKPYVKRYSQAAYKTLIDSVMAEQEPADLRRRSVAVGDLRRRMGVVAR